MGPLRGSGRLLVATTTHKKQKIEVWVVEHPEPAVELTETTNETNDNEDPQSLIIASHNIS